jgi:hypothetical protein
MTTNTTYNGWTNYATWRVNLEVFDGFDPYDYFSDNQSTMSEWLADSLKQYVGELLCETTPNGFALDYAFAFLDEVNWHEIAKHMIEEYAPEVEAENEV